VTPAAIISDRRLPGHSAGDASGFTLIELLVVLTIMAMLLVVVLPVFSSKPKSVQLAAAAADVVTALRLTRSQAILQNRTTRFLVDPAAGTFAASIAGHIGRVPPGVALTLFTGADQVVSPSIGALTFYPDGSSSGGSVAMTAGGLRYTVLVNWLSGNVSMASQSAAR
jgi:general secretion pathway protein H